MPDNAAVTAPAAPPAAPAASPAPESTSSAPVSPAPGTGAADSTSSPDASQLRAVWDSLSGDAQERFRYLANERARIAQEAQQLREGYTSKEQEYLKAIEAMYPYWQRAQEYQRQQEALTEQNLQPWERTEKQVKGQLDQTLSQMKTMMEQQARVAHNNAVRQGLMEVQKKYPHLLADDADPKLADAIGHIAQGMGLMRDDLDHDGKVEIIMRAAEMLDSSGKWYQSDAFKKFGQNQAAAAANLAGGSLPPPTDEFNLPPDATDEQREANILKKITTALDRGDL